jgi:hypothetical protein
MERRIAPGLIIDPTPSPRINPCPVSISVGSPAGGNSWEPDVAIFAVRAPIAIVIEVLEADDIARAVSGGTRIVIAALARVAPVVEIIRSANLIHFCVERVRTTERGVLAGMQRIAPTVAGGLAFAFTDGHDTVGPVLGRLDSVAAGPKGGEGLVGGIDFKDVSPVQPANPKVKRSGAELELNGAVVQVQERDASIGGQMNRRRA